MNQPLPSNRFRSFVASSAAALILGGWVLMWVGCGAPDSPDSSGEASSASPASELSASESPAIESSTSQQNDSSSSTESDAPGMIELPAGEIPPADQQNADPPSDGFQLPDDLEIPDTDDPQSDATSSSDPQVLYATWQDIETRIKSTGKITVVDLWSLACEPCLKEFPGLVALHRQRGSDVACIAVDMDYDGRKTRPPEYYEEKVAGFLAGVDAGGLATYICKTPSDDVYAAVDVISIPAVLVFDADGTLAKKFVDAGPDAGFTYSEDVAPFVEQLASN